jgi:hypothetical protein
LLGDFVKLQYGRRIVLVDPHFMLANEREIILQFLCYFPEDFPYIMVARFFDVFTQVNYQLNVSPAFFNILLN